MHRIDAAGAAPGNLFTDGNPSTGTPATVVDAAFLNDVQENLAQMIEAAGIVLSKGDYTQLLKAIVTKGLQGSYFNVAVAGGTADALTAAYPVAITALTNGMKLYVRAGAANTTTTPTFTPNSGVIAAKTIVKGAGSALAAGDIVGAGHWIGLTYDSTLDKWVLLSPTVPDATTTVKGVVRLATPAEAQALTDATKALVPATLAAALAGANQSLTANGYQKLPGGLIIQWGEVTSSGTAAGNATATFPVAFPTVCLQATATSCGPENMDRTVQFSSTTMNKTTLEMSVLRGSSSPSYTSGILVRWVALGY